MQILEQRKQMYLEANPVSYHSLLCHRCHSGYVWHRYYLKFHPRGFAILRSHGDILFGCIEPAEIGKKVAK
jgi:hypothetical protein